MKSKNKKEENSKVQIIENVQEQLCINTENNVNIEEVEDTTKKRRSRINLKCSACKQSFPRDELVLIGSGRYCCNCAKIKEKDTRENKKLNDMLFELAKEYNNGDPKKILFRFMAKQIKDLKDEYGWSSEQIRYVLNYIYCTGSPLDTIDPKYGIKRSVEFYFEEAEEYYKLLKKNIKRDEREIVNILMEPSRIIKLKRSELNRRAEEYNKKQLDIMFGPDIDLSSISDNMDDEE